jgi:hypothetical protein
MDNNNITTKFFNYLKLLGGNSDIEKKYHDAKLCLLDYLSCLVGGKGTRLKLITNVIPKQIYRNWLVEASQSML